MDMINMVEWKERIDISQMSKRRKDGEISIDTLAKYVINVIKKLQKRFTDENIIFDLDLIIENFDNIEDTDEEYKIEAYDYALDLFYDWGDTKINNDTKMCWIKAF